MASNTACAAVRRGNPIKDVAGNVVGHDCSCTRYGSTILNPELSDKDSFARMCLAVGATHKKVGGNVTPLKLRIDKTKEDKMNIASFEGYSPLDVFESDMVIESLKDLGIAFGAAALGAIASYEALAQIPYGDLNEAAATKDKILGYARPFLPAALGGVVGYFLKDYHAPAGYGLMGAGAALTAGLWYQHFRKGEGSKIPFQFTPHKEEMGGMIPALVPQFAGQQVGLVPQFAGYNEYSPENAIVL